MKSWTSGFFWTGIVGGLWFAGAIAGAGVADEFPNAEALLISFEGQTLECGSSGKVRNVVIRGSIGGPGVLGNATFEDIFVGERAKLSVSMVGFGTMTQGTDGITSWSTDAALGVTIKTGDEQAVVSRFYGILRRDPWQLLYESAVTVGEVSIDGRPHFELRMTPKSGKPDSWFIDAESYLLSRIDNVFPDPMGGELPIQWFFSDWRKVGGTSYPHLRVQKVGTMSVEFKVESIVQNAEIGPDAAAPPEDVVVAMKNPEKQTPKPPKKSGDCRVESVESLPTVTIRMEIPASQVSANLAIMLPEVMGYLAKTGAIPAGPPFSRYHKISEDTIDLEAGIPVRKAVASDSQGRVKASVLPGGKVAVGWHIGVYHDLPKSYAMLKDWIREQSLETREPFWEVYWTDPGIEPDPTKWRTQLLWPVK